MELHLIFICQGHCRRQGCRALLFHHLVGCQSGEIERDLADAVRIELKEDLGLALHCVAVGGKCQLQTVMKDVECGGAWVGVDSRACRANQAGQ